MTYKASYDNLTKIVTIGVTILFAVIIFLPLIFITDGTSDQNAIYTRVALLAIYIITYGFSTKAYQITQDEVIIDRLFWNVKIKRSEILSVEIIEGSDKLLKLKVNFNGEERQILSGIKNYYEDPQVLVGKKVPFVTNLAPRMMMGLESQGMILAVHDDENNFSLLEVDTKIKTGSAVS